ncbi:hypothetical protein BJ944DRAFT_228363 [Cunninghamella echinulata]|nr:hypothetical protein BJ944DRAFT_228363 [Cunninghamella echinulata]
MPFFFFYYDIVVISSSNTIVNMGDDIFWLWGGESYENRTLPNIAQIYDYKAVTITLFYIRGSTKGSDGNYSASSFNEVRMFDTKSSQWSYFNTTGHTVSSRISHTATQYTPPMDYCIIFDYSKNTFQNIEFPNPPNSVNIRYGHFADIYIETYLVMAFGFIDENTPATSLSVLDVTDPYQPRWATSFSNFPTNSTDTTNGFRREYIVAIAVPLLLIVIAIFAYFYKKRKQDNKLPKDPFVLEESNSSLRIQGTDFDGSDNIKFAKLTINHEEGGYNKIHDDYPADNFCKPLENSTYKNENEVEKIFKRVNM